MNGTSWANLKMMLAVIPEVKPLDEDDDEKPSSNKTQKSEVQKSLDQAGF